MAKKVVIGLVVLAVVAAAGLFVWARSVLTTDAVRTALAAQLSRALGQPVTIGAVSATIYPRVTMTLTGVTVGPQDAITVQTLDVGTGLRALLSRRIESATLRVHGARLVLPLPPLALASAGASDTSAAPVELVSIDAIVLEDVQLVSHGRVLRGDIDLRPHGPSAVTIRRIALTADGAQIDGTGEISSLAGPVGTIDLKAGALDLDALLAFAADFAEAGAGATPATPNAPAVTPASTAPAASPDLTVTFAAERASMAGVRLDGVQGQARLRGDTVTIDPLAFSLFGGSYRGSLAATLGEEPAFGWKASLRDVDIGAVTAFAGSPGTLTGRLAGDIDLTGRGIDAARAMKTARGTARLAVTNGTVKNLALVKAAVAATSLDPQAVIASSQAPRDEPFSALGATLAIAGGTASTQDLHFVSTDIRLDAGGAFKLDGSALTLSGQVQMSEDLSKQASSAILRVSQQNGRITLPITVTGAAGKYSINIDAASMAKRAVTTEATRAAQDAVKKGLGGLLRR